MTGKEYLQLANTATNKIQFWNEVFNLPLERFASDYSTGMKKKLAFIALLLQDRPIWLLDEPFNGVDFESNEKMTKIISALGNKKTILISSHILDKLTQVSDTIYILEEGIIKHKVDKNSFSHLSSKLRKEIDTSIQNKLNTLYDN